MKRGVRHDGKMVSAQEIACYAYCPEQWRLQYGEGLPPGNGASLAAGTRHHERNTAIERASSLLIASGRIVILAAAVLLLLWAIHKWS